MRGRHVKISDGADRRGREIAILLCDDFTSGGTAARGAAGRGRRFVVVGFATGPMVGASLKKIDSTETFLWAAARWDRGPGAGRIDRPYLDFRGRGPGC